MVVVQSCSLKNWKKGNWDAVDEWDLTKIDFMMSFLYCYRNGWLLYSHTGRLALMIWHLQLWSIISTDGNFRRQLCTFIYFCYTFEFNGIFTAKFRIVRWRSGSSRKVIIWDTIGLCTNLSMSILGLFYYKRLAKPESGLGHGHVIIST